MPIKSDTIRLLEACVESLQLAVSSLGTSKRIAFHSEAQYAPEIGLIGVAAELAMSACVCEANGADSLITGGGSKFKSFMQIRDDFLELLRTTEEATRFIFAGVENPKQHCAVLLDHTTKFSRLSAIRAAALHAGTGLLHETTVIQANAVADFLECLGLSIELKDILCNIPRCSLYNKDRLIFVDELRNRLNTENPDNNATTLKNLYLILPNYPENEPDWINAFERLAIAPTDEDISYLINTLPDALPASLRRIAPSGIGIPARITLNNADALPIEPQNMRTSFTSLTDQWNGSSALANGRLEANALNLPPIDTVREAFVVGIDALDILDNGHLNAHKAWAFIASSLNVKGNATPGPYWFIVKFVSDIGQLKAQLIRVGNLMGQAKIHIDNLASHLDAILQNQRLSPNNALEIECKTALRRAAHKRNELYQRCISHKNESLRINDEFVNQIQKVSIEELPVGDLMSSLSMSSVEIDVKRYWFSQFAESATTMNEVSSLVQILKSRDYSAAHTFARKALKRIDFVTNAPIS